MYSKFHDARSKTASLALIKGIKNRFFQKKYQKIKKIKNPKKCFCPPTRSIYIPNFKSQTQKLWPVGRGHRRRRRRRTTRMGLHMKMLTTVKKGYAPMANLLPKSLRDGLWPSLRDLNKTV